MATSVPVPIARPRSACGERGGVVDPVADHRDDRPSACSRRITSTLSAGRTSAITSSMPTSAATALAVVALSPVSSTGRSPSAAQLGDGLGARRLDRVGDDHDRAHDAVPADGDRRCPTACAVSRRPASRAAGYDRPVGEEARGRPTRTRGRRRRLRRRAPRGSGTTRPLRARPSRWARRRRSRADRVLGGVLDRPTSRSSLGSRRPRRATTSTRLIRPVVTVPVLSSTTGVDAARRLEHLGPLIRMPSWAPRPVPTSSAVGVARPSAHGQAMISTADGGRDAKPALAPASSQATSVPTSESAITTGTKTAETRSARRCTSALPDWASVTSRAICASAVSAPTRAARITRRPPAFTVAPTTSSPGCFSTGIDSPVRSDWSTADEPSSTMPSVAIFSPGRTTKRSPTASCAIGMRRSAPLASSTATSLAPSSSSARRAAPERRLARASK